MNSLMLYIMNKIEKDWQTQVLADLAHFINMKITELKKENGLV